MIQSNIQASCPAYKQQPQMVQSQLKHCFRARYITQQILEMVVAGNWLKLGLLNVLQNCRAEKTGLGEKIMGQDAKNTSNAHFPYFLASWAKLRTVFPALQFCTTFGSPNMNQFPYSLHRINHQKIKLQIITIETLMKNKSTHCYDCF